MEASDANATKRPSAEIDGEYESPFAFRPPDPEARLTSVVVFVWRSRTKTLGAWFRSPGWRLEASDMNATKRPSAEIEG